MAEKMRSMRETNNLYFGNLADICGNLLCKIYNNHLSGAYWHGKICHAASGQSAGGAAGRVL